MICFKNADMNRNTGRGVTHKYGLTTIWVGCQLQSTQGLYVNLFRAPRRYSFFLRLCKNSWSQSCVIFKFLSWILTHCLFKQLTNGNTMKWTPATTVFNLDRKVLWCLKHKRQLYILHICGRRRRAHFDNAEIKGLERGPEGSNGGDNSLAVCLHASPVLALSAPTILAPVRP